MREERPARQAVELLNRQLRWFGHRLPARGKLTRTGTPGKPPARGSCPAAQPACSGSSCGAWPGGAVLPAQARRTHSAVCSIPKDSIRPGDGACSRCSRRGPASAFVFRAAARQRLPGCGSARLQAQIRGALASWPGVRGPTDPIAGSPSCAPGLPVDLMQVQSRGVWQEGQRGQQSSGPRARRCVEGGTGRDLRGWQGPRLRPCSGRDLAFPWQFWCPAIGMRGRSQGSAALRRHAGKGGCTPTRLRE